MATNRSLLVKAKVENLNVIREFIRESAAAAGFNQKDTYKIILSVDEAATNIINHGYKGHSGEIEIEVQEEKSNLTVYLRDRAATFDPTTLPLPDITSPLEDRPLGGLGVFIMTRYMDEVTHHELPGGGNELVLRKSILRGENEL